MLPDRERWRAFVEDLNDTYRAEGLLPALGRFGEAMGLKAAAILRKLLHDSST